MYPHILSEANSPIVMRTSNSHEDEHFRQLLNEVPMKKGETLIRTDLPSPIQLSLIEDRRGFTVPILFQDTDKISGCASFSVWDSVAAEYVGFKAVDPSMRCGYFGDLRLSSQSSPQMRLNWRSTYRSWVERLLSKNEPGRVDLVTASILDENKLAIRSLSRGEGGIFYRPLYQYATVSVLLHLNPIEHNPNSENKLYAMGIRYEFRNPKRKWLVQDPNRPAYELPYFTLSKLTGMDRLTPEEQTKAWYMLMELAQQWSFEHSRPLFQFSKIGRVPSYFAETCKNEITRWESPATLYSVNIKADVEFVLPIDAGAFIDPSQL